MSHRGTSLISVKSIRTVMANHRRGATRSSVLRSLSRNAARLRSFGVKRLGLFGSVARGRVGPESDIDILVAFEPGQDTFSNLIGLHGLLRRLLRGRIDLVTQGGLSPYIGPRILDEVVYVEGLS